MNEMHLEGSFGGILKNRRNISLGEGAFLEEGFHREWKEFIGKETGIP
jgi:hypothetical protein